LPVIVGHPPYSCTPTGKRGQYIFDLARQQPR
jgi:hypothetical protein